MSPISKMDYLVNPSCIFVSKSEHRSIDCFIDQYVETRAAQSIAKLRSEVMEALRDFSCTAPVMLYEMNAWLDSRLGLQALHPDYLAVIDEFGDFPHVNVAASQKL